MSAIRVNSRLRYSYDRAAGVGVAGRLADMGQKAKGIPICTLGPLILCGIVGLVFAPSMLSNLIAGSASEALAPMTSRPTPPVPPGATNELVSSQTGVDKAEPEAPAPAVQIRHGSNQQAAPKAASSNPSPTPKRKLVGIAVVGDEGHAYFDDGKIVSTRDPKVFKLGRDFVIYDGHLYELLSKRTL